MENQEIIKQRNELTNLHSLQTFPDVYSPTKINKAFPIKSISDVFLIPKEVHTIGQLSKQLGEESVKAYLELFIFDFIEFINPARNMTAKQISQTAELILEKHYVLKVPEIAYVFRLAKQSYFGQIYEGIDGLKILSWFDKYFQDRLDSAELFSEREHQNSKANKLIDNSVIYEAYKKMENGTLVEPIKDEFDIEKEKEEAYQRFKHNYELNKFKNEY